MRGCCGPGHGISRLLRPRLRQDASPQPGRSMIAKEIKADVIAALGEVIGPAKDSQEQ